MSRTINRHLTRLPAFAGVLLLASCDGSPLQVVCIDVPLYQVSITAVSAVGGVPVIEGLSGTLEDGSYSEEMQVSGNVLRGARTRTGDYSIMVSATGFEPWSGNALITTSSGCFDEFPGHQTAQLTPVT
jgi:hypothetical protein